MHENSSLIDAWTIDSEENMLDLIISNVDFLTANYLERAIRIRKEKQIMQNLIGTTLIKAHNSSSCPICLPLAQHKHTWHSCIVMLHE